MQSPYCVARNCSGFCTSNGCNSNLKFEKKPANRLGVISESLSRSLGVKAFSLTTPNAQATASVQRLRLLVRLPCAATQLRIEFAAPLTGVDLGVLSWPQIGRASCRERG